MLVHWDEKQYHTRTLEHHCAVIQHPSAFVCPGLHSYRSRHGRQTLSGLAQWRVGGSTFQPLASIVVN